MKSSFTGAAGANGLDLNAANLDALGIGSNLQNMAAYSFSAQGGSAGGLDSSIINGADDAHRGTTTTTTTRTTVKGATGNAADAMADHQAFVANAFNAQNSVVAPVVGKSAARSFSFSTSSGMNSGNQMAQALNVVPMASGLSGSSGLSRSQSYTSLSSTPIVPSPVGGVILRTTTTTVRNVKGGVGGNGALLATTGMGAMGSSGGYTSHSSFSSGSSLGRQVYRSY